MGADDTTLQVPQGCFALQRRPRRRREALRAWDAADEYLLRTAGDELRQDTRVLLVNDPSSFVSGRLQTTREEGSIQGLPAGGLRMIDIPLGADVQVGDVVLTSGLGGNFPPDLLIGTVSSVRQFEFELSQEAEVRSLIDFDTLEFVLVVTSFQPVDPSIFDDEDTAN